MSGILMAFQDYSPIKGIFGSKWVGLRNFTDFFSSIYFGRTLGNTLALSLLDLFFGFPMPILFALLLNEVHHRVFKRTVQTLSYLPYFISMVVICGLIIDFTRSGGIISNLLASMSGGASQNLLGDPKYFRTIYIVSGIWQGVGYGSIIYLSALSSVDAELYEAARIDGANRWRQTLAITLPGIAPTIIMLLILKMGSMLAVGTDKILLLYSPATYSTSDVIGTYVYRKGLLDQSYGYSTAVGLFNSIVNTVFLLVTNWLSRKFTESSLF
jgi:putative aldouronate transport system permease protein